VRTGGPVPRSELVWSIQYQLWPDVEASYFEDFVYIPCELQAFTSIFSDRLYIFGLDRSASGV
jgi:hypothetical protein